MTIYNPLIFGKDQTEKIVSLEVDDNVAYLYLIDPLDKNKTLCKVVPNKFWILADEPLWTKSIRMNGELFYKYAQTYENRSNFISDRFKFKKKNIFSIYDPKEALMVREGYTYFKALKTNDISVLATDIETTGLEHNKDSKVILIANTFRDRHGNIIRKMFCYDEFKSDKDMFESWSNWVRKMDPDVITGHNINSYDLPYLQFCAERAGLAGFELGRDKSLMKFNEYESQKRIDQIRSQSYKKIFIHGREIVDTYFLAINYDTTHKTYESLGLKSIIKAEGLEKEDRVFYDANRIRYTYKDPKEMTKIKKYAEFDGDDALSLFDLYIPSYFYLSQTVPKSFQTMTESASGSQINSVMMRAYLQEKHSLPKASETIRYEGAISFGNAGIYNNVHKVDVASLYPNIMIQYNIYDDTKDPKQKFSELVKTFTERRLSHKKLAKTDKYYDDLQQAEKIFINSCYGFLGTSGLLFNSPMNAALVTKTGRDILLKSKKWAEEKGFQVINADTDSISYCKDDQSEINEEERKSLLDNLNSLYPERIRFEDDGYYKTIIVLKAKNYILWDGKKLKTKGSALKDSKKEIALKEFTSEIINTIIENQKDQIVNVYNKYVLEIMNVQDIKRWSSKKTISPKVLESDRTNEAKIRDAISGEEIVEGDKVYLYFKSDESLGLADKFDGKDYHKDKLLEKLYKATLIFDGAMKTEDYFINYKLSKNKQALCQLLGIEYVKPIRAKKKKDDIMEDRVHTETTVQRKVKIKKVESQQLELPPWEE